MPEVGAKCIRASGTADACIIFMHGILSDGEAAWTNASGESWPQMLANNLQHDAAIYTFTYRSDVFCRDYSLGDVVDSIRVFFDLEHLWQKRRLIFVCHSMGGIAARRFIVADQAKFIQNRTQIGLFLVASPSLGSRDANAMAFFARLIRNSQAEALRFSQSNTWLNDLNKDFRNLKEGGRLSISGKELVEDEAILIKKFLFGTQTVEPWSAAQFFGEPYKVPYSDHISIAKPKDTEAIQYRLLLNFIDEMMGRGLDHNPPIPVGPDEKEAARHGLAQLEQAILIHGPKIPREAVITFNEALMETRRYIAEQKRNHGQRDLAKENVISGLWMKAADALYPLDHRLASLCMIKGNGWIDESVWDDPRYKGLPLKLNDMLQAMINAGGDEVRDIIEGQCKIDTVSWRKKVVLPPFKAAPKITLSRAGPGSSARDPEVESVTEDQFTIRISSTDQAGQWNWRARGTLVR
jgi:Alpha/beta hydrolase family